MLVEILLALAGSMPLLTGHWQDPEGEYINTRPIQVAQAVPGNKKNAADGSTQLHGQSRHRFTVNLRERSYVLYTPKSYRADQALPLVVMVGDINTRTRRFIHYIRFNELADRHGFIVAYPDVYRDEALLAAANKDDGTQPAKHLQQLIEHVRGQRSVRANRIFVAGFSTGGITVLSALCRIKQDIAGFAVVAASMPRAARSHCGGTTTHIPGLFIVGRDDPYIAWQIGATKDSTSIAGLSMELLPVLQAVEYWTQRNQCDLRPLIEAMPNRDLKDGTSVTRLAYDGHCAASKPVILFAITGGGHTWPGNRYQPPFEDAGRTSQDIDASQHIWGFFSESSKAEDVGQNRN